MVTENQTLSISEFLVPKTGSISIITQIPGANVYLDKLQKDQTPLDIFDLPVKDYIIRIELWTIKQLNVGCRFNMDKILHKNIILNLCRES